jgi:hypothetical protein
VISLDTVRTLAAGRLGTALLVAAMAIASVLLIPRLAPGPGELDVRPVVSLSTDGADGTAAEG